MARSLVLQQRPYTFAQTNLSPSFFACDKAADYSFRWTLASDLVVQEYKPGWRQNSHPLTLMLVLLAFHPRSCVTTSSTDDVDLRSPQPGVQLVISRKPWLTRYP